MPIPLLEVTPKTQNQRVAGYEVPDEDDSPIYRVSTSTSDSEMDLVIWAAYRQIFSEHLILESYRQSALESQLRNRMISIREFVRGLGKSDVYRTLVADANSNYRLVDITFKRFLGRESYNKDERIAWSIVIATKGLHGFIDAIVDSEEYQKNFGDEILPYQRRRMEGRPFNLVNPRYSDYWRNRLMEREGLSYYTVQRPGQGNINKKPIKDAIPANFLSMARGILVPQVNYQRTTAQASFAVSATKLDEMTQRSGNSQPPITRTDVALPYRYLPSTPKA